MDDSVVKTAAGTKKKVDYRDVICCTCREEANIFLLIGQREKESTSDKTKGVSRKEMGFFLLSVAD